MKIKKNIISLIVGSVFVTANASTFNVIVSKDNNDYQSKSTIKTDWVVVNSNVCNVDNESSNYYYGEKFNQHKICINQEERTVTEKIIDKNGIEKILEKTEYRDVLISDTNTEIIGSHIENNCEDILNNGYSEGNKEYRVGFNNSDVYCDMTNGGWMRLTNYDFEEDSNNIPPNMNKRVNHSYTTYTGANYTLVNGWYGDFLTSSMITANPSGLFWTEVNADTNGFNWKETKIEINSI